ncbi:MAG: SdpI family protein [Ferruginibacter sp.]|nr:SdpI family protein [Cytophagales bacterium]
MDPILVGHALLAGFFTALAVFFKKKQPSAVNSLFGYRTPFSTKNQPVWEEANRYSTNAMLLVAGLLIAFQAISYSVIGGLQSFTASGVFLAVASALVVPITEIHLRKVFDPNGQRKNASNRF